jgi:hypothetical protein
LKTGTENIEHPNEYERGNVVKVPVWDFLEILMHYLLDHVLFGNKDHLVNSDNPFSKYVPEDPKGIKEYLTSHHYSKTYDMAVKNPDTDFLLPIKIYIDKTGKTAQITSTCGEPILVLMPLLKKWVREQPSAWQVLMFISNLEKGSSAKKRQESQCELEKGRGYHNYHRSHQGSAVHTRGDGQQRVRHFQLDGRRDALRQSHSCHQCSHW